MVAWVRVKGLPATQTDCMFGAAVKRLISVGSKIMFPRMSNLGISCVEENGVRDEIAGASLDTG